jgi:hypothetical protein
VRLRLTVRSSWRRIKQCWRAWRARLHRDRATLALVVLLTLGIFEPLLCIIHCQIWLPIALHSYFAAQHQHQHAHVTVTFEAGAAQPVASTALIRGTPITAPSGCSMDAGHGPSDLPFGAPPSPIHDMIPVLVLPLIIMLRMVARAIGPPGVPPHVAFPPLLRPPIPSVA